MILALGFNDGLRGLPVAAMKKNLEDTLKMAIIPFLLEDVAARPELNFADGLHPNAKGHQILMETVWKKLETILKLRLFGRYGLGLTGRNNSDNLDALFRDTVNKTIFLKDDLAERGVFGGKWSRVRKLGETPYTCQKLINKLTSSGG